MIIGEPVQSQDGRRIAARIDWEDSARTPQSLYFALEPPHRLPPEPGGSAFLVAAVLAAWNRGERRVRVEGPLCPMLRDQIRAPLRTLAAWYPELGPPPVVEARARDDRPPRGEGAVSLLSCGVDSLATLRSNRLTFGRGHPLSVRACLLVDMVDERTPDAPVPNPDAGKIDAARRVCADAGAEAMMMRTNLWSLDGDGWFFAKSAFGAMYASTALCLAGAFCHAFIAASLDAEHPFVPAGSSPLLDPYYSTGRMQVHHHGTHMSRLERTRLIAEWPVALDNLRVCVHDVRGTGNCGTCEKCIRTMLMLVALGRLEECAAFPVRDVDRALLETVVEYRMVWVGNLRDGYAALVPLLERRGRHDLVAGIDAIVADFSARAAAGDPAIIAG